MINTQQRTNFFYQTTQRAKTSVKLQKLNTVWEQDTNTHGILFYMYCICTCIGLPSRYLTKQPFFFFFSEWRKKEADTVREKEKEKGSDIPKLPVTAGSSFRINTSLALHWQQQLGWSMGFSLFLHPSYKDCHLFLSGSFTKPLHGR